MLLLVKLSLLGKGDMTKRIIDCFQLVVYASRPKTKRDSVVKSLAAIYELNHYDDETICTANLVAPREKKIEDERNGKIIIINTTSLLL